MKTDTITSSEDLAALIQANGGATRKRRRWMILVAVLLLTGITLAISGRKRADALTPRYVTTPVERGDLTLTVTAKVISNRPTKSPWAASFPA